MKRIIFLLSTLALTLSLVSCQKELRDVRLSGALTYSVEAAEWDNAGEFPTKSAFFTDADYNVTDCNIWVYEAGDNTGKPVNTQSYFETLTNVDGSKLFPDPFKSYDFFMFANVGEIAAPATLAAAKEFKHDFTSVTKFYEKGFPMASSYYSFSPASSTSGKLLVKKLVSQYNVKFDFTDGGKNDYDFVLKSAAIKQSAKTIRPFMQNDDGVEESAAKDNTEVEKTADMLSPSDVSDAISGKGVQLYMIENVLGEVFKEDVRIPDNLIQNDQERATYIEFVGSLDKRDGTGYHSVTCRYYFGKGRRAEVKRNYITDVQLNLKNTILDGHDKWTVEPADPYNDSWVMFNPSSLSITGNNSFTSFYTTTGVNEEAGNEKVKYYIDYNSSDYSAAGLTLQYSKTENGSYSNYTKGTELVGPYYFKVKSNYTGSTQKTVNFEAICLLPNGEVQTISNSPLTVYVKSEGGDVPENIWEILPVCMDNIQLTVDDWDITQQGGRAHLEGTFKLYSLRQGYYLKVGGTNPEAMVSNFRTNITLEDVPMKNLWAKDDYTVAFTLQTQGLPASEIDARNRIELLFDVTFCEGQEQDWREYTYDIKRIEYRNWTQKYLYGDKLGVGFTWTYNRCPSYNRNFYYPFFLEPNVRTITVPVTTNASDFCVIPEPEYKDVISVEPLVIPGNGQQKTVQLTLKSGTNNRQTSWWCPLKFYSIDGCLLSDKTLNCAVNINYIPDATYMKITKSRPTDYSTYHAECFFYVTEDGCHDQGYLVPGYHFEVTSAKIILNLDGRREEHDADVYFNVETGEMSLGYQDQSMEGSFYPSTVSWHLEFDDGRFEEDFQ